MVHDLLMTIAHSCSPKSIRRDMPKMLMWHARMVTAMRWLEQCVRAPALNHPNTLRLIYRRLQGRYTTKGEGMQSDSQHNILKIDHYV